MQTNSPSVQENLILSSFINVKQKQHTQTQQKITGKYIKEREYAKHFGVVIDKALSWTYHINHVNLESSRGKATLIKHRHYVSKDTLHMFCFAFVQPDIDSGLTIWGSAMQSALKLL